MINRNVQMKQHNIHKKPFFFRNSTFKQIFTNTKHIQVLHYVFVGDTFSLYIQTGKNSCLESVYQTIHETLWSFCVQFCCIRIFVFLITVLTGSPKYYVNNSCSLYNISGVHIIDLWCLWCKMLDRIQF